MPLRVLRTDEGQAFVCDEGESFNVEASFYDASGTLIDLATVTTLEATLYNRTTDAAINSRLDQDVKNTNGGTISSSVLTLRLDALDNVIVVSGSTGDVEYHVIKITATYSDGTTTRTKITEKEFGVRQIAAPA